MFPVSGFPADENLIVQIGCTLCGQPCPYTRDSDPPLTLKRAEIWACLHPLVCPAMHAECDHG